MSAWLFLWLATSPSGLGQPFSLISSGALWRFANGAVADGSGWRDAGFDDSAWAGGPAPLGHGEAGVLTDLGTPGLGLARTVCLRREVVLPSPTGVFALTLRIACDDGAMVTLNGTEVYRRNLPGGPLTPATEALAAVEGADERLFRQYPVASFLARPGTNVIAVELHQDAFSLPDAWFDLALVANLPLDPPRVQLTSPTNGQVFPVGTIPLRVAVSDTDGFVYWVRYTIDGEAVGDSLVEPFGVDWAAPVPGRHRLVAEAIDNSGRRRESAPVYFQVGAGLATRLIRGPYLQSGSSTSIVVRWRTDWPSSSVVRYGLGPGDLDFQAVGAPGIDHEVLLTGLTPGTVYHYAVGSEEDALPGGGGNDFQFKTDGGPPGPLRIWAIGDSGTAGKMATAVREAYLDEGGATDVWLMLGDNAYESGTDGEYQRAVFDMYPELLRRVVLWPTLGNHDAGSSGQVEAFPYLEIFSLPRRGEAGGAASGTELYYSFDRGNVHFICLDSMSSDRRPGSPMLRWLEADLAMTDRDWVIAYWHHPPYTWGTHNSDSEQELIEMRTHVVPVLERGGVDLVLSGHSHNYERTLLLNGHHGPSSSLDPRMILDATSGDPRTTGAYRKPWGGLGAGQGAVYVVCGCSGEGGPFTFPRHPAMARNLAGWGSVVLDIDGLRLTGRFLTAQGLTADTFAIDKSSPAPDVAPRLGIGPRRVNPEGDIAAPGLVDLFWPTSVRTFSLESQPLAGGAWTPIIAPSIVTGRQHRVTVPVTAPERAFRLISAP